VHTFAPGPYLYVGSALAARGATSLGPRLLRHTTRSTGAGHPLRRHLRAAFPTRTLPQTKRLRWHVDYLLDAPAVVLTGAIVLRTTRPLESSLARWLSRRPYTTEPVAGAGASDAPGQTHLLGVVAYPDWWSELCRAIICRFGDAL
jgi:Uri superfamily endonuclease